MRERAPKLWKDLSNITISTLESTWYRHLVQLENTISCETHCFFRNRGLITIHLPITTGSISSPMGRGSDSSPVKINLFGVETYLADSMQFMLEYGCRLHEKGCYYIMPSFRGEDADERHLCQFYHSEVEIPGDLNGIIKLAEDYVRYIASVLLSYNKDDILNIVGGLSHICNMVEKDSFPRVTMEEAVERMNRQDNPNELYTTDPEFGFRNITRKGEQFLMQEFDGIVWLTKFDHLAVPFYQAFDVNKKYAKNADLLFGIGEVVGAGERHRNFDQIKEALQLHSVCPDNYLWYMKMKEKKPLQTAGFGMGVERFLLWILQHDDIRDLQILPRFNGIDCTP